MTGPWIGNDQAQYFVSHFTDNDDVFWAGLHESGYHPGLQFTNVFRGRVDFHRGRITGEWVDVPRGKGILHQGRLTLEVVETNLTGDSTGNGERLPGGRPPGGGPAPTPQVRLELRQVPQETTGGFGGTVLTPRWPSDLTFPQDIGDLFNRVRRSGPDPIRNDIEPLKDFAVIQGFVGAREYSYGWDVGAPHDYCHFVDPDRTSPSGDGDINFDLELDAADRDALDQQPGFWTDWVRPTYGLSRQPDGTFRPLITGDYVREKLLESFSFHCEIVMFGREQQCDDCVNSISGLLPAWAESDGDSVLVNGLPINGRACPAQPGQNLHYTYFDLDSPELSFRQELRQASRVRVTGVIAVDHGHFWQPDKLEIHPVYSLDFQQDFQDVGRRPNADLSGVWHCNDVGTYYIRQVDSQVWWLGLSRDQGRTFANVFQGTIDPGGTVISGDWADIPVGINGTRSNGGLRLRLDGSGPLSTTFAVADQTGGFGGTAWYKLFDRPFGFVLPGAAAGPNPVRQSRFVTWHRPTSGSG